MSDPVEYRKFFDPTGDTALVRQTPERDALDRRDGSIYEHSDQTILAVNVALATGRPLFLRGAPGSGKSSLAANVARRLNWRYYEDVISSRTQARDLLWRFDALRRLNDAHADKVSPDAATYVEPGVLWWAFDRESAIKRGSAGSVSLAMEPRAELNAKREQGPGCAVVLLDEIDKADPDVPNDLLVPLGSLEFTVVESGRVVKTGKPPFIVLTSNDEREMPAAFLRRCVVLDLPDPDAPRLVQIGKRHYPKANEAMLQSVAERVIAIAQEAKRLGRRAPSTPEYLDAVNVCSELRIQPNQAGWTEIENITLRKRGS